MAGVATSNPPAPPPIDGPPKAESLAHIDIGQLSQSELYSLSLCSGSAFDVRRTDDVLLPYLNRSLFNESAGSRRQTYTGLRRHQRHRHHHNNPGLLKPRPQPTSDPENHSILHFLKHYLQGNHNPPPPPPPRQAEHPVSETAGTASGNSGLGFLGLKQTVSFELHANGETARKARKIQDLKKERVLGSGVEMEVLQKVNRKGEVVDFEELEKNGDALYGEELRKRTLGVETEEKILGFLSGVPGQWCSTRKKRKFVDASEFGYVLPLGWKLLLGIKRRNFHATVYCRRYISPTGQQFISCKEAASFLRSYFGLSDSDQPRDQRVCSIRQAYAVASKHAGDVKNDRLASSVNLNSTASRAPQNEGCLMGIDNLPEVQVRDVYECDKCNFSFKDENAYLQHLLSFHQKTTKRHKVRTHVGKGVIIKDGKYECQFCHKVFEERRSYNGHVGNHVKGSIKPSCEQPAPVLSEKNAETSFQDALKTGTSKMDALVEIAQNSIIETSNDRTMKQDKNKRPSMHKSGEDQMDCTEFGMALDSAPAGSLTMKDVKADQGKKVGSNSHGKEPMLTDEDELNANDPGNIKDDTVAEQMNAFHLPNANDMGKSGDSESEIPSVDRLPDRSDDQENTNGLTGERVVTQNDVHPTSLTLAQALQNLPFSVSNEEGSEFPEVDQKLENDTGFDELRFDDLEPFNNFVGGHESHSLPGGPVDLGRNAGLVEGFTSSVGFDSREVMLKMMGTHELTVCVWCRTEFKLEVDETEFSSDSIGYICPACKAKISGHFNDGLSMDSHGF